MLPCASSMRAHIVLVHSRILELFCFGIAIIIVRTSNGFCIKCTTHEMYPA
jgi:hypothetical protein